MKIRLPGRTRQVIHTNIDEIDLRDEIVELFDEDPAISEIDLREEFEDWMPEYDPNKKRN